MECIQLDNRIINRIFTHNNIMYRTYLILQTYEKEAANQPFLVLNELSQTQLSPVGFMTFFSFKIKWSKWN